LHGEDGAVGREQFGTLHTRAARTRTDEHADVGVLEGNVGVIRGEHAGEQREGAVVEFHDDALAGLLGLREIEQLKDDRLVLAQHFARGNAEQQCVTDLAGGAGDSNTNRCF